MENSKVENSKVENSKMENSNAENSKVEFESGNSKVEKFENGFFP